MTPESGIGAGLSIGIDGTAGASLRDFPERVGRHLDPNELHVTLIQPGADIAIPVHSQIDAKALADTQEAWAEILASQRPSELELERGRLQRLGRHVCFILTPESSREVKELRVRMARIAHESLFIGMSHRDFMPHLSIARLHQGIKTAEAERVSPPTFPKKVQVTGFDIWQNYREDHTTRGSKGYTNRPVGLRYA